MGMVPLFMGVVDLKTDRVSLMAFLVTYLLSIEVLEWWLWQKDVFFYDCFILSVTVGVVTYLLAHIFQNGGFVLLRRDPQVISERLIVPNIWLTKKVIPRIRFIPFFLPAWAQREATGLPMPTMTKCENHQPA